MTKFSEHDDEEIVEMELGPVEKAQALVTCLDYIRAEAVELDITELDWLLGAARMAVADFVNERTRPSAALLPLQKTRTAG